MQSTNLFTLVFMDLNTEDLFDVDSLIDIYIKAFPCDIILSMYKTE